MASPSRARAPSPRETCRTWCSTRTASAPSARITKPSLATPCSSSSMRARSPSRSAPRTSSITRSSKLRTRSLPNVLPWRRPPQTRSANTANTTRWSTKTSPQRVSVTPTSSSGLTSQLRQGSRETTWQPSRISTTPRPMPTSRRIPTTPCAWPVSRAHRRTSLMARGSISGASAQTIRKLC